MKGWKRMEIDKDQPDEKIKWDAVDQFMDKYKVGEFLSLHDFEHRAEEAYKVYNKYRSEIIQAKKQLTEHGVHVFRYELVLKLIRNYYGQSRNQKGTG